MFTSRQSRVIARGQDRGRPDRFSCAPLRVSKCHDSVWPWPLGRFVGVYPATRIMTPSFSLSPVFATAFGANRGKLLGGSRAAVVEPRRDQGLRHQASQSHVGEKMGLIKHTGLSVSCWCDMSLIKHPELSVMLLRRWVIKHTGLVLVRGKSLLLMYKLLHGCLQS